MSSTRHPAIAVVALLACPYAACGGCGAPQGVSSKTVAGIGSDRLVAMASLIEPEALLADVAKARHALVPSAGLGRLGVDLGTADGWEEIGVDLGAGLTVAFDARVTNGRGLVPILLSNVGSREALVAALGKLGPVSLDTPSGASQEFLVDGLPLGHVGAVGGATAFVLERPPVGASDLREGFEQFLVGQGSPVSDDASFRGAAAGLASGPGVLVFAPLRSLTDWPMDDLGRRERELVSVLLTGRITAAAARVGDTGFGARVLMPESAAAGLTSALTPKAPPPRLATLVPAEGWAAARVSVNLAGGIDGLINAVVGAGVVRPGQLDSALARAGFTWSEISEAFDGHFGLALDLGSLTVALTRYDPLSVNWLGVLGVTNEAKVDALVAKTLMWLQTQARFTRSDTRIGETSVIGLGHPYLTTIYLARHDKMLLVAPSIAGLIAAIEGPKNALAGSDAGKALSGRGFVAVAAELSPLLTLAELTMNQVRDLREWTGIIRTPSWQRLREQPSFALELSTESDGILVKGSDASLSYGALVFVLARLLERSADPALALPRNHGLVMARLTRHRLAMHKLVDAHKADVTRAVNALEGYVATHRAELERLRNQVHELRVHFQSDTSAAPHSSYWYYKIMHELNATTEDIRASGTDILDDPKVAALLNEAGAP